MIEWDTDDFIKMLKKNGYHRVKGRGT